MCLFKNRKGRGVLDIFERGENGGIGFGKMKEQKQGTRTGFEFCAKRRNRGVGF